MERSTAEGDPPPPPPVGKRPDVAARLKARRELSETVVKCKLNALLKSEARSAGLVPRIQERVDAFSRRIQIASLALNLLLRETFHDVPTCVLYTKELPGQLFDQTFIRQLITGTECCHKPILAIQNLYQDHPTLQKRLQNIPRHTYDLNILTAGAKKFLVNLKNMYTTQLSKWIKGWVYSDYVKRHLNYSSDDEYLDMTRALMYDLHNWETLPSDMVGRFPERILKWVRIQKSILGCDVINKVWFQDESSFPRMVRYAVFYNRFIKTANFYFPTPPRQVALSPITKIRSHFMTLDKTGLKGLVKDCFKQEDPDLGEWRRFLNIHKVQGKDCTFTDTIETDGVTVCVHFRRPKKQPWTTESVRLEGERLKKLLNDPTVVVLGVDPGRTNIFYVAYPDPENQGQFLKSRFTRKQYYQESGVWKAQKQTEKWHSDANVKKSLEKLSKVTTRGDSLAGILEYLEVWKHTQATLRQEYSHPKWANQRLRLYGGKKRAFTNYFNTLKQNIKSKYSKDVRILTAYGSANFAPGGRNEVSVPTTRAFKEWSERFWTLFVDEFRTTALWSEDANVVLKRVMRADTRVEIRGLHWCDSTNGNGKLVTRDLNAAINIRKCLVEGRPENMTRRRGLPRLRNPVGCWLPR